MSRTSSCIWFFVFFLSTVHVFGQQKLVLNNPDEVSLVNQHFSYFEDQSSNRDIEEILSLDHSESFIPMPAEGLRPGLTSSAFWLRLEVENANQRAGEYILEFNDPSLYLIEQYHLDGKGGYELTKTGISLPQSEKALSGNNNDFTVFISGGETEVLLYRVESINFITISADISPGSISRAEMVVNRTYLGIFYGILFIIIIYNLFLYISTNIRAFLYYILSILFFGFITGTYDGFTPQYHHYLVKLFGGYHDIITAAFSNTFTLLFMNSFLDLPRNYPRFSRFTSIFIVIQFLNVLLIPVYGPFSFVIVTLGTLLFVPFIIFGGIIGLRHKKQESTYYLIAYSTLSAFLLISMLSLGHLIPLTIFTKYSLHIGYFTSMIILSYGISKKVSTIKESLTQQEIEKEKAKQEVIEQKNKELELKILERTGDILRTEINLRAILDHNTDEHIWLVNKDFEVIDYNKIFFDAFKLFTGNELERGVSILEKIPIPELRELWKQRYIDALKGEPGLHVDDYEVEGEMQHHEIRMFPILDKNEKITGVSVFSKDITNRTKAEIQLKSQNEELKKLNKELDSFVYSASHDLRAPLASVQGLIRIIRDEGSKKERVRYLDLMNKSISRLDNFIKEIVDFSRNSRMELKSNKVDLNETFNHIFDDLHYLNGAKGIEKNFILKEQYPLFSDESRLKIIFANVISNAIKHGCGEGTRKQIDVEGKIDEKKAKISVSDYGPGISSEHLDKIFNMFYKGTESYSGTGLGLYIAKETAEKLGGSIQVESKKGKGTRFVVTIPNNINPVEKEVEVS